MYGSKDHSTDKPKTITYVNGTLDHTTSWPDSGSEAWSRYGTNTTNIRLETAKRPRVTPPLVWKSFKTEVKTGKKVFFWSKKLGRVIYKPEFIWEQRLVPDYSVFKKRPKKKKEKSKKLFTSPNLLQYRKNSVVYYDPTGSASWRRISNNQSGSVGGFLLGVSGAYIGFGYIPDNFNLSNYVYGARHMPGYDAKLLELDAQALSKLHSKVKAQEVNIAQLLAERKQTIGLINSAASKLIGVCGLLARKQWKKAWSLAMPQNKREAASIPLIVDFGIKPLMSDIEGLMGEFNKDSTQTKVVKSVAKHVFDGFIHNTQVDDSLGVMSVGTQVHCKAELTVRYVATIEVTSLLSGANRLGLTNPGTILWELTPWSFVVDWFLPIGNYINNMDAFWGWKVKSIHRTVVYNQTINGQRTISGASSADIVSTGSGFQRFVAKSFECVRNPLSGVPSLPFPQPKSPISLPHAVDALALFNQFLLRRK